MKKAHNLEKINGGDCAQLATVIGVNLVVGAMTGYFNPQLGGMIAGYNIACN